MKEHYMIEKEKNRISFQNFKIVNFWTLFLSKKIGEWLTLVQAMWNTVMEDTALFSVERTNFFVICWLVLLVTSWQFPGRRRPKFWRF